MDMFNRLVILSNSPQEEPSHTTSGSRHETYISLESQNGGIRNSEVGERQISQVRGLVWGRFKKLRGSILLLQQKKLYIFKILASVPGPVALKRSRTFTRSQSRRRSPRAPETPASAATPKIPTRRKTVSSFPQSGRRTPWNLPPKSVRHDLLLFFKEVARGGERTRVLLISFIFSFFTTLPLSNSGSPMMIDYFGIFCHTESMRVSKIHGHKWPEIFLC
jgi:hypothetical protein